MKKTITLLSIAFSIIASAQTNVADFESFMLTANSAYSNTNSIGFQTAGTYFEHKYDTSFSFWSGGFAYTNIKDSATAGFSNLYGVKALNGYNSSNMFAVGQQRSLIKTISPTNAIDGFYITNTTYAYKSMLLGDAFAKKFGGTSGNDPDFFKVTIRAYHAGVMKNDSVEFYLADFRFSNNALDYIVDNWQWVNTSSLGVVDSIRFYLYSSDNGAFGMNTPAFFAVDNVTTSQQVGLNEVAYLNNLSIYPNPFENKFTIKNTDNLKLSYEIFSINGKLINADVISELQNEINLSDLEEGIYFIKLRLNGKSSVKKIVKY